MYPTQVFEELTQMIFDIFHKSLFLGLEIINKILAQLEESECDFFLILLF
jgi:hypothetical protein